MKTVVCVFAHPDDEAFGPAGSIAKLAKKNNVYIICVTKGDAQKTTLVEKRELAQKRKKELLKSASLLGVQKVFFLGFADGSLCNNIYHSVAKKIQEKLEELQPDTLITFEQHGISGHIDHIAVSMITSYIFERMPRIKKIMYHCILDAFRGKMKNYFIYFPEGYKKSEIDEVVDITDVWDMKQQAMKAHTSQIKDVNMILKFLKTLPKEEYFLVREK